MIRKWMWISMKIKNKFFQILKKLSSSSRKEKDINYYEATELIKNNADVVLLDVRSMQEYEEYHLNGAINIPLYELRSKAEAILSKNNIIIVYCQSGIRSKKACKCLEDFGYENLYHLKGGLNEI